MATLRRDPTSKNFRIRFRFEGKAFNRTLKTKSRKTATSVLGRVQETIRLIEHGRIDVPSKVDPAAFILSDGKLSELKSKSKYISLKELLSTYQARLPAGAKEQSTIGFPEYPTQ